MTTLNGSNNKKKKLIDFNASDSDDEAKNSVNTKKAKNLELTINKNYAQRYDTWRGKEELQKRNYTFVIIQICLCSPLMAFKIIILSKRS
jgi:hypothetical protein